MSCTVRGIGMLASFFPQFLNFRQSTLSTVEMGEFLWKNLGGHIW